MAELVKVARLTPEEISPGFTEFILRERGHVTSVSVKDNGSGGTDGVARDFCVDPLHEPKRSWRGAVVVGSSLRRTANNDVGLETPRIFMEKSVEERAEEMGGEPGIVTAVYSVHLNCGEELVSEGLETVPAQREAIEGGWQRWQADLRTLQRLNPSAGRRIELVRQVADRGTAPLIDYERNGRVRLVNPDFDIERYGMGEALFDRLVTDQ